MQKLEWRVVLGCSQGGWIGGKMNGPLILSLLTSSVLHPFPLSSSLEQPQSIYICPRNICTCIQQVEQGAGRQGRIQRGRKKAFNTNSIDFKRFPHTLLHQRADHMLPPQLVVSPESLMSKEEKERSGGIAVLHTPTQPFLSKFSPCPLQSTSHFTFWRFRQQLIPHSGKHLSRESLVFVIL